MIAVGAAAAGRAAAGAPAAGPPADGPGGAGLVGVVTDDVGADDRELAGSAPPSGPALMLPGFGSCAIEPDRSLFLRPPTDLAAGMRQE
jgi:hypothetical protein